jgi:hypothetical protein
MIPLRVGRFRLWFASAGRRIIVLNFDDVRRLFLTVNQKLKHDLSRLECWQALNLMDNSVPLYCGWDCEIRGQVVGLAFATWNRHFDPSLPVNADVFWIDAHQGYDASNRHLYGKACGLYGLNDIDHSQLICHLVNDDALAHSEEFKVHVSPRRKLSSSMTSTDEKFPHPECGGAPTSLAGR